MRGVLKLGDEIEVRPGVVVRDNEGKVSCRPIFSRIMTLFAENNDLKFAVPGGLIGISLVISFLKLNIRCGYSYRSYIMPC